MKKYRKIRRKNKINKVYKFFVLTLLISTIIVLLGIVIFEKRILPNLMEMSYVRSKTVANQILDNSISELLLETNLTNENFISSNNNNNQIIVNSQLINSFSSDLSIRLNEKMALMSEEVIDIPLGSITQLNYFSEFGPIIPFRMFPVGVVTSDYETDFISSGINQTNYKIWIYVTIEIQIANPFYKEAVSISKKVMLIDTIIRGDVPEQYVNLDGKNIGIDGGLK